jgi:hypothetical protein
VAVLLALVLGGCGDYRGPRAAMDLAAPPARVGPYSVLYAQAITSDRRQACEAALWAHHSALDAVIVTPAWQTALGNPTPLGVAWPQREVHVYDVAFLRAPHALAVQGWTDPDTRTLHLVAGEGDTLPDATAQLIHSVYLPYDVYRQEPVWPFVLSLQSQTVAALRRARGLP